MKLNGKNIITDSDVTVLERNSTLADILKQQDTEISQLKSNVKWLYKYGGVGSGSGGGNGSGDNNKRWYILVDVNGTSFQASAVDDGTTASGNLILNGEGSYPITVQVVRPNGGSFNARITYFNGVTSTMTDKLTTDNEWFISKNIILRSNNQVSVRVTDGEYTAIINISYISAPYKFKLELAKEDGSFTWPGASDDMYITDIEKDGLCAKFTYDIGVEVATDENGVKNGVTYYTTDILGNKSEPKVLDLSAGQQGSIMLPLIDDPKFLTDNSNAASYAFSLNIQVVTNAGGTSSTEQLGVSFNLIPGTLYLKIIPNLGTFYTLPQSEPGYVYTPGPKGFTVTPYFGLNEGKQIQVSYYLDHTVDEIKSNSSILPVDGPRIITERVPVSNMATIELLTNQDEEITEHVVVFKATCGNNVAYFTYYLYVKELDTGLNWYPDSLNTTTYTNYFRTQQDTVGFQNWPNATSNTLNMTINSEVEPVVTCERVADAVYDMMFSVGILYSEINNTNSPIISITGNMEDSSERYIHIFPNKIVLSADINATSGNNLTCYIPQVPYSEFTAASDKYHLITFYRRLLTKKASEGTYEVMVYVDGVLDGVYRDWFTTSPKYNQIIFRRANYYVNFCELSYFPHSINSGVHSDYLNDANIVRYWYTYQSKKLSKTNFPTNILNVFETGVKLSSDVRTLNMPILTDTVEAICSSAKIPILLFTTEDGSGASFVDWYTSSYLETANIPSRDVKVYYASPTDNNVSEITTSGCKFKIDIQGSTTRSYRCKNLELTIENNSQDSGIKYLFSPNFNPDDPNSFLPESSFTLKADAVDSSHSNNTTMGDFINAVTTHFSDRDQSYNQEGPYTEHVKNCLCGFACLVFIQVTAADNTQTTYYLGIYNFNLGRNSLFNLGYVNTKGLTEAICVTQTGTGLQKGFNVYMLNTDKCDYNPKVFACEIANNGSYYDFSQYHETVLFPDPKVDDKGNRYDSGGMFDDIKSGLEKSEYEGILKDAVKSVAKAGGFIFNTLKKTFTNHSHGYSWADEYNVSMNAVPDYRQQHARVFETGQDVYTLVETIPDANMTDLDECVNALADQYYDNPDGLVPYIDYQSLLEYYTICMAFGLFDSVQKNLTLRSFNKRRFYLAFYDMDTCLGVDNSGDDADYFAFSDYWVSSEQILDKEDHNKKPIIRPSEITIYRDFTYNGVKGFDIPSTYLFAIAKYAYLFNTNMGGDNEFTHPADDSINLMAPADLWATWRQAGGILETAQKFIDNFYVHHMNNVDECMFNYNYRSKYFAQWSNSADDRTAGYDSTNIKKFKGRRIEYVRQWLSGRFHIMDAYFNLPKSVSPIMYRKDDKWLPVMSNSGVVLNDVLINDTLKTAVNNNPDVYVVHSIFDDAQRWSDIISLNVQSRDYSPVFIIPSGGNIARYLLTTGSTTYNIYYQTQGFNAINIAGSSSWTYLENINSITGACTIKSNNLEMLTGTSGTITSFTIVMPAIKYISLTSPNYSGSLKLANDGTTDYPNLGSVTLSNTAIKLEADNLTSLNEVIYHNGKSGGSIKITNCPNIKTCQLSGTFDTINITHIGYNINWTTVNCASVIVKNKAGTTRPGANTFTMANNTMVTSVDIEGFDTINITNCPKLKKVLISGKPTSVTINPPSGVYNLVDVEINAEALTYLNLYNNQNLDTIKLTSNPSNVTELNLNNTKITSIAYPSGTVTDFLDLRPFEKL